MTDDVRRVRSEEARVRIQAARRDGGLCGLCGRALAEGEPVWMECVEVGSYHGGRGAIYWRAPVCEGCASPAFRAVTDGTAPERCAGCGRGLYYAGSGGRRRLALCSTRCSSRYQGARAREARR